MTLSDVVKQSSGAEIPLGTKTCTKESVKIHLGKTSYVKNFDLGIEDLDDDRFVIAFPDESNIVIAGGSEFGTKFGVSEFLERFVGVRWLFPGKLGLHIPNHKTITQEEKSEH